MTTRRGFSLVELLTVIVVIAILAAIVIPRFVQSRERAVTAMLQADLRYLATLQEVYWNEHRVYAGAAGDLDFEASEGVVVTFAVADRDGWGATAAHPGTPVTCAFYVGSATPVAPATGTGAPECAEVP
ncbi:prepilin-type N-terminal cleavage/methylation domain-containing protein [Gaopeijia maritima]|uniref:type IV pilin protein n=1 Tax=Gaopeijia maritima TaxID=3119007 RepID=UPI003251B7C5